MPYDKSNTCGENRMKTFKTGLLIFFSGVLVAAGISCAQVAVPSSTSEPLKTTSTTTQAPLITATIPNTITITQIPSPTVTSVAPSPSPTQLPIENPADNKTFFTGNVITGYIDSYLMDGTLKQTPIYKELYFDLNLVGYYTLKDAIFVPRIPTFTTHDDWFIRPQFSGNFLKSWIFNWGYSIDKSKSTNEPVSVSLSIYYKDVFEKNYYLNPGDLIFHDLKGETSTSSAGIQSRWLVNGNSYVVEPSEYVFLIRTNNATVVSDWWIKIGTESKINNRD
jgi:hypothetical protein